MAEKVRNHSAWKKDALNALDALIWRPPHLWIGSASKFVDALI